MEENAFGTLLKGVVKYFVEFKKTKELDYDFCDELFCFLVYDLKLYNDLLANSIHTTRDLMRFLEVGNLED